MQKDYDALDLIEPSVQEKIELESKGYSAGYWGSGLPDFNPGLGIYTELRQNIVLLICAMNDEL